MNKESDLRQLFIEYEMTNCWWASLIFWEWGQDLAAKYVVRKVNRKLENFKQFKEDQFKYIKKG